MRRALALLALLLSDTRRSDTLRLEVPAGTVLVRTCELSSELELESYALTLDGQEVGDAGTYEYRMQHEERRVVTDSFEEVREGRPVRLRRSFDDLGGQGSTRVTTDANVEEHASEFTSALEGQAVLFAWDEETKRHTVAYAEGSAGDEAALAGLVEDMDLAAWLPPGPVAAGETWSIDARAFRAVLEPAGDVGLVADDGSPIDSSPDEEALLATLAGTIHATLRGVVQEGDARIASIELAVEAGMHAERALAPEEIPEGGGGTLRTAVEFVLAGELRWDLVHGHARGLDLAGTYALETVHALHGDFDGEAFEQTQTQRLKGTARYSFRFERR